MGVFSSPRPPLTPPRVAWEYDAPSPPYKGVGWGDAGRARVSARRGRVLPVNARRDFRVVSRVSSARAAFSSYAAGSRPQWRFSSSLCRRPSRPGRHLELARSCRRPDGVSRGGWWPLAMAMDVAGSGCDRGQPFDAARILWVHVGWNLSFCTQAPVFHHAVSACLRPGSLPW